jgi:outer membrane protein assembly factor BamA
MRPTFARPALLAACFLALCLPTPSAQLHAQSFVVPAITFTRAPAYSQAELLAFTGLKPGGSFTQQQLDDAAQRLNDLGLFTDVSFSGNAKGLTYTLQPVADEAMLPARFGNFVWWQDDEINRTLQASVPLYRPAAVPIKGNLRDTIAAALQAMLAKKGVPDAHVMSLQADSAFNGPLDHIAFDIDSPPVLIRSLTVANVSAAIKPKLDPLIRREVGHPWDKLDTLFDITNRVETIYRDEGYLDVAIQKLDRSDPTITPTSIDLALIATVEPGEQYRVKQMTWAGSDQISVADFNKQNTFKPGNPASPDDMWDALAIVQKAYRSKGYLAVKIDAPPVIDHATHLVSYTVSAVPGPQYRFRSVHWAGISDADAKNLDAAWKMKPGDVYDSTYVGQFLGQNNGYMKQGLTAMPNLKQDDRALTVDLTLTFTKAQPK